MDLALLQEAEGIIRNAPPGESVYLYMKDVLQAAVHPRECPDLLLM
jgi:hypothetical protein